MDAVGVKQLRLGKDLDNKEILSIRPRASVFIGGLIANWAGYEAGSARVSAGPGRARVSKGLVPKDWKTWAAAHGHEVGLKIHSERRLEGAAYDVGSFFDSHRPRVIGEVDRVELDEHVVERPADRNRGDALQREADYLDGYWRSRASSGGHHR